MVNILVTENAIPLDALQSKRLCEHLPANMVEKAGRFRRWQDAQAYLMGKFLLINGLKAFGIGSDILHQMQYTEYNRPYLPLSIDFNISHAGRYIVCAISEQFRIGIDIEEIQDIDIEEFAAQFTGEELSAILASNNKHATFFSYWTIKEAVIKADGRGLSIPLQDIVIGSHATVDGKIWNIHKIDIAPNYVTHLAVNTPDEVEITVETIRLPS